MSENINWSKVKALLSSPIEANQRVGLSLIKNLEIPKDVELSNLISNSTQKLIYCKEYGLEAKVSSIKIDKSFRYASKLSLRSFPNLKRLYINNCRWEHGQIPFPLLMQLDTLSFTDTQLNRVPRSVGLLEQLEVLYLGKNKLRTIDYTIMSLEQLRVLVLSQNRLQALHRNIGNLSNLQILNLKHNKVQELPRSIGQLINLEVLNLANNKLEYLPTELGELTNLKVLNLSHNGIHRMPQHLVQGWQRLERLHLTGNPVVKSKKVMRKLEILLPNTNIIVKRC